MVEDIRNVRPKGRYRCGSGYGETAIEAVSGLKERIKSSVVEAEAATEGVWRCAESLLEEAGHFRRESGRVWVVVCSGKGTKARESYRSDV